MSQTIVHDLKNPACAVLSTIEYALEEASKLPEAVVEALQDAQKLRAVGELLVNLLDMTRIETARFRAGARAGGRRRAVARRGHAAAAGGARRKIEISYGVAAPTSSSSTSIAACSCASSRTCSTMPALHAAQRAHRAQHPRRRRAAPPRGRQQRRTGARRGALGRRSRSSARRAATPAHEPGARPLLLPPRRRGARRPHLDRGASRAADRVLHRPARAESRMRDSGRRILIVDDNRAIHDDFRKILSPRRRDEIDLER
jgi:hypothetical protein